MTAAFEAPRATIGDTVRLARPATRGLVLSTLLGAACIASAIALLGTSAWLISRCAQHGSVADLGLAVVSVRFFALSRGLFRYGERLVGHDGAFRALARLRVDVYVRLERVAPAGLQRFRRGDLLTRVVEDVDALQDIALRVLPAWGIAAVVGAATTLALLLILPAAAIAVGVALLLAATAVPWISRMLARRTEARRAPARGALTASVIDLLEGAPDLVAFAATEAHVRRLLAHDAELTGISAARARTAGVGSGLIVLCTGLAMWLALVLGVSAVHAGHLQGVMLAVVALIPLAAFELVAPLPAAAQALEGAQRSAGRLNAVMDQAPPVVEPAAPRTLERTTHHGLDIRGLRARYAPDSPWALDGVDLDLTGGRHIALVGASGAGKSTLASVLVRFVEYSGSVRLDGVEIRDLEGDDVRRHVGLVEQDAHVFDSTLRENLRLAKPAATDDEILDALARARLLDWVTTLPLGLDTALGEHGSTLSGGQRQRLAVARALLADFPILILDEPGEHLDAETADALTRDLLAATAGRTTLLITHRLAALESVDEIVVLDHGHVVESAVASTAVSQMRGVA
jgi:thiol reductant ABC exporter CydC subunit